MVTFVSDAGRTVDTGNVALVAPAGTVMLPGTEAILAELLERVTLRPPVGAGPLSVTVPVDVAPPFTLVGWRVSDANAAGGPDDTTRATALPGATSVPAPGF